MKIDIKQATSILGEMLTGAALDEFRVHSTQLELSFINDGLVDGCLLYVRLVFSCRAFVSKISCQSGDAIPDIEMDFFEERAKFLSDVYGFIGKKITDLRVDGRFSLHMAYEFMESINLYISQDDFGEEDWIWKIFLDEEVRPRNTPSAVYCLAEDRGIILWVEE